jgi:protein-S-isoprenylcysteine O-methyltransferase Ste14
MTTASNRFHRLANWAGFLLFAGYACVTLSKMPAAGVFMAPTVLFEFCVAISFLIRDQPRAATSTLRARISAYSGTFLVIGFFQLAARYPGWIAPRVTVLTPYAFALWIGGSMWLAYSAWYLRHSFSIEPAARRLVTSGPYGFARHPIYTGYFAQYVGMWVTFPTLPFAIALLIWAGFMLDRMRLEEALLGSVFPEYAVYKTRVGALCPVLFRRAPRQRPREREAVGV